MKRDRRRHEKRSKNERRAPSTATSSAASPAIDTTSAHKGDKRGTIRDTATPATSPATPSKVSGESETDEFHAYIKSRTDGLYADHRRWIDAIYKFLGIVNTGGAAVAISAFNQVPDSIWLKCCVTFFISGTLTSIFSLNWEFSSNNAILLNWIEKVTKYHSSTPEEKNTNWNQLIASDKEHAKITWIDKIIGYAPGFLCGAGLVCGIAAVWLWSPTEKPPTATKVQIQGTVPVVITKP